MQEIGILLVAHVALDVTDLYESGGRDWRQLRPHRELVEHAVEALRKERLVEWLEGGLSLAARKDQLPGPVILALLLLAGLIHGC